MNSEFKDFMRYMFIIFSTAIPFLYLHGKHQDETIGVILMVVLIFFYHQLSKKWSFFFIDKRIYISSFITVLMIYLKIM